MGQDRQPQSPSDAELVAYLDGELSPAESVRIGQRLSADPGLKARIDKLIRGGRPFAEAFEPLLAKAPVGQLEAMLAKALPRPGPELQRWPPAGRYGFAAAAAAIALFAGIALDRLDVVRSFSRAPVAASEDAEAAEWRDAVAQYLTLYTRDTLEMLPDASGERQRALGTVGARLGLALTPETVGMRGLTLKRADLYEYDGKDLAFLAYLDPQQGPVALCIIRGGGEGTQRVERRRDMNVVYWSQAGRSFMLIGHASTDRLQKLAAGVEANLAAAKGGDG